MKIDLTSKRGRIIANVTIIVFATYAGFAFVDFIQTQRTRDVFTAIGKANDARVKKGESLDTFEVFVRALHAIDTDYTKKELKPVFVAYVSGFDESLALIKAGKSTASADAKIATSLQELVEIAKKYE